ncbi:hypothetical protein AAMO2058_000237400 [Amorphochlora amoebiformis]
MRYLASQRRSDTWRGRVRAGCVANLVVAAVALVGLRPRRVPGRLQMPNIGSWYGSAPTRYQEPEKRKTVRDLHEIDKQSKMRFVESANTGKDFLSGMTGGIRTYEEIIQEEKVSRYGQESLVQKEDQSEDSDAKFKATIQATQKSHMPRPEDIANTLDFDPGSENVNSRSDSDPLGLPQTVGNEIIGNPKEIDGTEEKVGFQALNAVEKAALQLDIWRRKGELVDESVERAVLFRYTQNRSYFPDEYNGDVPDFLALHPSLEGMIMSDPPTQKLARSIRKHLREKKRLYAKKINRQKLLIKYMFFNGKYHSREIVVRMTDTVRYFLQRVHRQLVVEFNAVRSRKSTDFLVVKKETILRLENTFYHYAMHKKRHLTKSSRFDDLNLFDVDIKNDIKLAINPSQENDPIVVIDERLWEAKSVREPFSRYEMEARQPDHMEESNPPSDSSNPSDSDRDKLGDLAPGLSKETQESMTRQVQEGRALMERKTDFKGLFQEFADGQVEAPHNGERVSEQPPRILMDSTLVI